MVKNEMLRPGRRAPRLAAGALLAVVMLCSGGAAASSETGPAVIRLTDVQSHTATVRGGTLGRLEIIQQRLYGSASKQKAIGHALVMCTTLTERERSCEGTYLLPRGMLLTRTILQSRLFYTAAITGGTGLYNNARGTLTVTETRLRPRREILLFRLTG